MIYILLLVQIWMCLEWTVNAQHGHGLERRRSFRVPAYQTQKRQTLFKRQSSSGGGGLVTYDDAAFSVPLSISGQALTMTISTGSADMWVASTLMPPKVQKSETTGQIFNPNTSSTYTTKAGYTFLVTYGDGSAAQGPVGVDEVSIGNATVSEMPFGTCSNWTFSAGGTSRDTTGQLGLAFKSINSITPEPQCTFMECLVPELEESVFTTAFKTDGTGYLDFGFIDQEAYTGELSKVSIDNSTGFWGVKALNFGIGGQKVTGSGGGDLVFDSGSTLLYLPSALVSTYVSRISGKTDNSTGAWTYPCDSDLPDLEVYLASSSSSTSDPVKAIISGENLKLQDSGTGTSDCYLSVYSNEGIGFSLLGIPFFVDRYIVFNQSEPSVSFADGTSKGTIIAPAVTTTSSSSAGQATQTGQTVNVQGPTSSISTGAQAGIGVGVAVAGLLLIGLAIWLFRRHKKQQSKPEASAAGHDYEGKPELEGQGTEVQRSELRGESVPEMPGHDKPAELQDDVRYELHGGDPQELPAGNEASR